MRVIVDTNVVISGVFFGGYPRKILKAIVAQELSACASESIVEEYLDVVDEMIGRRQGHLNRDLLAPLINALEIIKCESKVTICRDPDDNKFLECAIDAKASYIISGDKDLLTINAYRGIHIFSASEFCKLYEL